MDQAQRDAATMVDNGEALYGFGTARVSGPPMLVTENGSLVVGGIVIGRIERDRLTLNLGWMKAAGVAITVQADPEVDTKRGGVVLRRDNEPAF